MITESNEMPRPEASSESPARVDDVKVTYMDDHTMNSVQRFWWHVESHSTSSGHGRTFSDFRDLDLYGVLRTVHTVDGRPARGQPKLDSASRSLWPKQVNIIGLDRVFTPPVHQTVTCSCPTRAVHSVAKLSHRVLGAVPTEIPEFFPREQQ